MTRSAEDDLTLYPARRESPLHPSQVIARRRTEKPVAKVRIWDGSEPWLITRYQDFRAALADERLSADATRAGYPAFTKANQSSRRKAPTFISMDEPDHGYFRRMLIAAFSVRRMRALQPQIRELVDELLDAMEEMGPPVDLVEHFTMPLASKLICLIMGIPYEFHAEFQAYAHLVTATDTEPAEVEAVDERLHAVYLRFMNEKRLTPSDDLLSMMVNERVDTGQVSEEQMLAMLDLLLVAGHDTTANQIALGTLALFEYPEQADLLRQSDDPAFVVNAVEDLLRFVTITHAGRRRVATEDVEIGGQLIRAGEGVIMANESANRDPDAFENADRLDFTRPAQGHVAFGYGVHQCLGQGLARAELQEAFPRLLRRFPDLRLAVPFEDLRFQQDSIIYGVESVPVTWGGGR